MTCLRVRVRQKMGVRLNSYEIEELMEFMTRNQGALVNFK